MCTVGGCQVVPISGTGSSLCLFLAGKGQLLHIVSKFGSPGGWHGSLDGV
jgi:hypothetical protein